VTGSQRSMAQTSKTCRSTWSSRSFAANLARPSPLPSRLPVHTRKGGLAEHHRHLQTPRSYPARVSHVESAPVRSLVALRANTARASSLSQRTRLSTYVHVRFSMFTRARACILCPSPPVPTRAPCPVFRAPGSCAPGLGFALFLAIWSGIGSPLVTGAVSSS
jgi:hypothetical protein